jgi:hypothetical protein
MTTSQLFGRAWNVQVLTPPDGAHMSTLCRKLPSDRMGVHEFGLDCTSMDAA